MLSARGPGRTCGAATTRGRRSTTNGGSTRRRSSIVRHAGRRCNSDAHFSPASAALVAASAEWRVATRLACAPAVAKAQLRQLLVIASAAEAKPGPDCLLAEGLTSTTADAATELSTQKASDGSWKDGKPMLGAKHPLLAGLECYSSAGCGDEPSWRPLAMPAGGYSSSSPELSEGEQQDGWQQKTPRSPACMPQADCQTEKASSSTTATSEAPEADAAMAASAVPPAAAGGEAGVRNAFWHALAAGLQAGPKWFQPSDAVKVINTPDSDGPSERARVLLVDHAEKKYKVRMRSGEIRTVPAELLRPLRFSMRDKPTSTLELHA